MISPEDISSGVIANPAITNSPGMLLLIANVQPLVISVVVRTAVDPGIESIDLS